MKVVGFPHGPQELLRRTTAAQRGTLPAPSLKKKTGFSRRPEQSSLAEYRRPDALDINAVIRDAVRTVIKSGLRQVTIAAAVGWTPTRFSRWLNAKDPRAIDVQQIGRIMTFLKTYRHAIDATIHGIEQSIIDASRQEDSAATRPRRRSS